jgi:hypothetical protein
MKCGTCTGYFAANVFIEVSFIRLVVLMMAVVIPGTAEFGREAG